MLHELFESAIALGYEVIFFDEIQKRWFDYTPDITDEEINEYKYSFFLRPKKIDTLH